MPATNTSLDLGHDLLFRNQLTGQDAIWLMNGTALTTGKYTTAVPDANWSLAGAGDFNSDGHSDLVWRNQATGEDAIWLMNGTSLSTGVFTTSVADLNWQIVGIGDFNSDGNSDLVWRNQATGENAIWLMHGSSLVTSVFTTPVTDLNWQIVGSGNLSLLAPAVTYAVGTNPLGVSVGDFNGDGMLDLAVANIGSDTVSVLLKNDNGTFQTAVNYAVGRLPRSNG